MTENRDQIREGGCACDAVRYRMAGAPIFVHCCHCRSCQRETGSAFALNVLIEADRVTLLDGDVELVNTPSESGAGQKIFRCSHCRVALWSNYAMPVGERIRFVRAGTLDDSGSIAPDIHIFTRSKVPWLILADDVPVMAEYYDRKTIWPAESLARYDALRG
ncbi:MAG: GFA family protein [Alphaproteobacteria bacterium]